MIEIVSRIHSALGRVFDVLQGVLSLVTTKPLWQLAVLSFLFGVMLSYFYGKFSNQQAVKKVKGKIVGLIYEGLLFRHDLVLLIRVQLRLILSALQYASLAIKPIMILAIPSIFLFAQLDQRFSSVGLIQNESILVHSTIANPESIFEAKLTAPDGISVVGPVRVPESGELVWRLAKDGATSLGELAPLTFSVAGSKVEVPLNSSGKIQKADRVLGLSIEDRLLSASTIKLPHEFKNISIQYREGEFLLFGLSISWLVWSILQMFIGGIVGAKIFGVTF